MLTFEADIDMMLLLKPYFIKECFIKEHGNAIYRFNMYNQMKCCDFGITGLLVLCNLIAAVPGFAEVFIRMDRDDPEAWKNDLANVRFLMEERMSGLLKMGMGTICT